MACIITLVFIVLNVRDGTESKYPSIVFLSIAKQPVDLDLSISLSFSLSEMKDTSKGTA